MLPGCRAGRADGAGTVTGMASGDEHRVLLCTDGDRRGPFITSSAWVDVTPGSASGSASGSAQSRSSVAPPLSPSPARVTPCVPVSESLLLAGSGTTPSGTGAIFIKSLTCGEQPSVSAFGSKTLTEPSDLARFPQEHDSWGHGDSWSLPIFLGINGSPARGEKMQPGTRPRAVVLPGTVAAGCAAMYLLKAPAGAGREWWKGENRESPEGIPPSGHWPRGEGRLTGVQVGTPVRGLRRGDAV